MNHLHTGFYIYNKKIYFTREDAFDDMLLNQDYNGNLKFYYNDIAFSKLDWTVEPNIDISTLYKLRAQQLRDAYKYIIVSFSGGSDSTQVLHSFLKNDIFIDEIQISTMNKMASRLDKEMMIRDKDLSFFMEHEYAVLPMLRYAKEKSPNTKITIIDSSDFLYDQLTKNKFDAMGNNPKTKHPFPRLTSAVGPTYLWWNMYNSINVDRSKDKESVCIVRGMEKPILTIDNRNVYFQFSDQPMLSTAAINKGEITKTYTIEDFFWSVDMPLIPIKQSHMIVKKFRTDKEFYNKFVDNTKKIKEFARLNIKPIHSPAVTTERMLNEVIYPDYDRNTFIAPKPTDKSAEFKLFETAVGAHHGEDFEKEMRNYKENKYINIVKIS